MSVHGQALDLYNLVIDLSIKSLYERSQFFGFFFRYIVFPGIRWRPSLGGGGDKILITVFDISCNSYWVGGSSKFVSNLKSYFFVS